LLSLQFYNLHIIHPIAFLLLNSDNIFTWVQQRLVLLLMKMHWYLF